MLFEQLLDVAKRKSQRQKRVATWQISRLRETPAVSVGLVDAPGRGQRQRACDQTIRHSARISKASHCCAALSMMAERPFEKETDNPIYTDNRNFFKVLRNRRSKFRIVELTL